MRKVVLDLQARDENEAALRAAFSSCGYQVVNLADHGDGAVPPDSLLVRAGPDEGGPDREAAYSVALILPVAQPLQSALPVFTLTMPVRLADVVVSLQAMGFAAVTPAELEQVVPALYSLAGDDATVAMELIKSLRSTTLTFQLQIHCALRKGDNRAVSSLAHRLKSSASMVSCTGLVKVCATLELYCTPAIARECPGQVMALAVWMDSGLNVLQARLDQAMESPALTQPVPFGLEAQPWSTD